MEDINEFKPFADEVDERVIETFKAFGVEPPRFISEDCLEIVSDNTDGFGRSLCFIKLSILKDTLGHGVDYKILERDEKVAFIVNRYKG